MYGNFRNLRFNLQIKNNIEDDAEMFFIARIPDRIMRIQMGFGSATLAFASH